MRVDIDTRHLLEHLPAGGVLFAGDRIRYINPAGATLLDAENTAELIDRSVMDFIHPLDQARITARIRRAEAHQIHNPPTEFRIHTCKGNLRVIGLTSVTHAIGTENGVLASFMDMTARSEMEQRLRESDENFRSMLENMQDVFYRTDAEGVTRLVCPAVRNILGYEPNEIIGRPAADFYPKPEDRNALREVILREGAVRDFPGQMVCKDGRVIDISISTRALFDEDGQFSGVEGIWRDITERRQLERELELRATIDELTGISNRRMILNQVEDFISRARTSYVFLLLDLDHFKSINDRYGHLVGDKVLKHFAEVVRSQLRANDLFGRLGGEEFCILLAEDAGQAQVVAERICQAVNTAPVHLADASPIRVSVSIGVAHGGPEVTNVCTLLERADSALYEAKQSGRNRVFWQSP